jgi:sialate O-acetylesterase
MKNPYRFKIGLALNKTEIKEYEVKNGKQLASLIGVVTVLSAITGWAEVKLPPVLSSHMVLQRDMAVPVWGTAATGEKVTVKFRTQEKSAVTDDKGNWMVKLDALKAGDPDVMTVSGTNTLKLEDVLVGEVWVGSGQSNMDMPVSSYTSGDEVLAKAASGTYPKLRLIRIGNSGWNEAVPANIEKTSALLFSFGLPLQQKLDVPVGLLVAAVGGTPSGYWLSEEAYANDAACKDVVAKYAATYSFEDAQKRVEAEMVKYEQAKAEWDKLSKDEQKGKNAPRKPAPALKAGECNNKVGHLYAARIKPFMPFAIRGVLWDQGESGTAIQGVDQYTLMGALIRGWRQEWGQGDFPFIYVQKPSGSGCAWDPTDSVTGKADKFSALPPLVPNDGANRELHIRIMQYPNTAMVSSSDLGPGTHPTNKSGYGARAYRTAMGFVYGQKVEFYGPIYQSSKIDGNKVVVSFTHVGQGLAFKEGAPSATSTSSGQAGSGQGKLQGFALAGKDRQFVWADAVIVADTVVVSSDKVTEPAFVRYAWAQQHPWANLFNKDGLPALPFRTDN